MSERAQAGLSIGTGVVVVVVVAVALPTALLVYERFLATPVAAPTVVVQSVVQNERDGGKDAGAVLAAANAAVAALDARIAVVDVERRQLEKRAIDGDRGERLRLLGRAVAKAREVRRAAGQSGQQLRTPFPVAELDLDFLSLGDDRWLLTRDGKVVLPAGTTPPIDLKTSGRDEDVLVAEATVAGASATLVRRCVAGEAYCVVDVERPVAAVAALDLGSLKAALASAASTSASPLVPALVPPSSSASSSASPASSSASPASSSSMPAAAVLAAIAFSLLLLGLGVKRLRDVGSAITRAAMRLRTGVAGRKSSAPTPLSAEFQGLDRAIDEAFVALADHAAGAPASEERRRRLGAVAAALDAARVGNAGERVGGSAIVDDPATAHVVVSANLLLESLDERARRWSALIADVPPVVLPGLAERLLRLARVQGLAQSLVDELTSLGTAVAEASAKRLTSLQTLKDDVARVTPAGAGAADRLADIAALRDLPAADVARLTEPESPSDPPRPSE